MIKRKRKYREKKYRLRKKYKRGRGIGDGFKFLYSIGKQWRKSVRWKEKKLCNDETRYS